MATDASSKEFPPMRGRAWQLGDNVPTDQIVATAVVMSPMDVVLKHVLEELKPEFPNSVKPGDIIVAGDHFGQSSGRAVAAKAILGLYAVAAQYQAAGTETLITSLEFSLRVVFTIGSLGTGLAIPTLVPRFRRSKQAG